MVHVSEIIRHHHERYDGQGFPDGLEGDGIPLGARILAVAEDYDELQQGWLASKAFDELQAHKIKISTNKIPVIYFFIRIILLFYQILFILKS